MIKKTGYLLLQLLQIKIGILIVSARLNTFSS